MLVALAETWPEAAVAIAATAAGAWLQYLTYRAARDARTQMQDSTVLTRSTDQNPDQQADALRRRQEDDHDR